MILLIPVYHHLRLTMILESHAPLHTKFAFNWMGVLISQSQMTTLFLSTIKTIKPYPMGGIAKDDNTIACTGKGFFPWTSDLSKILMVPCYFSSDACETIISLTNVIVSHPDLYSTWCQYAHADTRKGSIQFIQGQGIQHTNITLTMHNALWYYKVSLDQ